MTPPKVNIVGPNGEEAEVLPASLDVWLRNGWKKGKDNETKPKTPARRSSTPRGAAKKSAPKVAAHRDSAGTLSADGRTAKSEE